MKLMTISKKKTPLYVGMRLDGPSMDEIMKVTKGVKNRTSRGEVHITIIYSKTPIAYSARGKLDPAIEVKAKAYSIFTTQDGESCLVLELDAPALHNLHNEIMEECGASYDFDVYKPHITMSYDVGEDFDLASLTKIEDIPSLYCHQEYASKLNINWGKPKDSAA